MVPSKSLDNSQVIACLLHDVSNVHGLGLTPRVVRLTCNKVRSRTQKEGLGFLTKTLPRLGKHLDKALTGSIRMTATEIGFDSYPGCEFPRFLGELFMRIFRPDGTLLPEPCTTSVAVLRDVLYLFYKYELPYTDEQEHEVIQKFERTEDDLHDVTLCLQSLQMLVTDHINRGIRRRESHVPAVNTTREAQILLSDLFAFFDPTNIVPRHGPGAVATKQQRSGKFLWTNVSGSITDVYPYDAYFCASQGHVCDSYDRFHSVQGKSLPARVVLVPKDSRGPRLISCEPVDYQWVQQGLGKAIVEHVERHDLTRDRVNFTNQYPNQCAALYGSRTGKYATLDLKEASDRISTELVRLLFPKHIYLYLEACRSTSTSLPSGKELKLKKFAPMGSSLCFPILALTVWAILTASSDDPDVRDDIRVYGDDVIVPTAYAARAIEQLESFGLMVNRDKSCTTGFFRESCGMDAFHGVCVTPVRIRTVWSSSPCPNAYASWVSYANSFWRKQYYSAYDYIVGRLLAVYGPIPSKDMHLACPSLEYVPVNITNKIRRRTNKDLQKVEFLVRDVESLVSNEPIDGWSMLLRFFTESSSPTGLEAGPVATELVRYGYVQEVVDRLSCRQPLTVSSYTRRRASMLVRRWR